MDFHPRLYMQKDRKGDTRTLQVKKNNYGRADLQVKLLWQNGVYVPVNVQAEAKADADAADKCFLRMLDSYTAQGRHVSHKSGANYAPNEFAKDKQSGKVEKAVLVDAMNRLFEAGHHQGRNLRLSVTATE